MIVLCLAGLIAHIMSKALRRDISQNELVKLKQEEKLKKLTKQGGKRKYDQVAQTDSSPAENIQDNQEENTDD